MAVVCMLAWHAFGVCSLLGFTSTIVWCTEQSVFLVNGDGQWGHVGKFRRIDIFRRIVPQPL